jgi:hypothetical protein
LSFSKFVFELFSISRDFPTLDIFNVKIVGLSLLGFPKHFELGQL